MKRLIAILIMLFIFACLLLMTSCKARKTAKSTTTVTQNSTLATTTTADSTSVDTSKKDTHINQVSADSSENKVEIQNDAGEQQNVHVNADGSIDYTGKGKRINITTKHKKQQTITKNTAVKKAITTHKVVAQKKLENKSVKKEAVIKTTDSKFEFGWKLELISVLILLVVGVFLYSRYRKAKAVVTQLGNILPVFNGPPPPAPKSIGGYQPTNEINTPAPQGGSGVPDR